ncbi:MAG: acetylornithine transaminase [Gemmatimonadota bacterium]
MICRAEDARGPEDGASEAGYGSGAVQGRPPGPETAAVIEATARYLFQTYNRAPVAFSHGRGTRLWDLEGKPYLDFVGGIAVSSLGHGHPALVETIAAQAARYLHVSNLYHIPEQTDAAELLVEASGLERAFFCNSGTEANEGAIKLARKRARERKGPDAHEIVAAENGFHGRTLGALSATGVERYRAPFEPLPAGFRFIPYNDAEAAEAAVGPRTCAVIVEPIQGESGVIPATREFLHTLQRLCREHDALLVLDEIQTGVGRTGELFAFRHYGLEPDVVTLAKGLGGGVPVGAVLAREEAASHLVPGDHGTTFGGNPLACAAACVVLRTIIRPGFLAGVRAAGERLRTGLAGFVSHGVREVRGLGLLVGADLESEAAPVATRCLDGGLLVNAPRPHTLRLAPPLTVAPEEVDEALEILAEALKEAAAPDPR